MDVKDRSVDPAAQQVLLHTRGSGPATTWDRYDAMQPQCGFGELGLCCDVCFMGPCRIDPFGEGAQVGACGATADLIVARNLARAVAAGAAAHSDHGREVVAVLGETARGGAGSGYAIANPARLAALAAEWGIATSGRSVPEIAGDLAAAMAAQFGQQEGTLHPVLRAPEGQRARWTDTRDHAARHRPRGRRIAAPDPSRASNPIPIAMLRGAMRAALADGWGGSMIATDVQDVLFGGPQAIRSRANLGVLDERQVNVLVHGHEPTLSEMIVDASRDAEMTRAGGRGRRGRDQRGRHLLHRQRDPDAAGHAGRGQLPAPGAGAAHRRGGPDGGGRAVRHAVAARGRRLPSHQGRDHLAQGPYPGRRHDRLRSAARQGHRPRHRPARRRGLHAPRSVARAHPARVGRPGGRVHQREPAALPGRPLPVRLPAAHRRDGRGPRARRGGRGRLQHAQGAPGPVIT